MTKKYDTNYWAPERINTRIDTYVEGIQARIDGQTLGVNPYSFVDQPEEYMVWREGWLEGRMYEQGRTKLFLLLDEPEEQTEEV